MRRTLFALALLAAHPVGAAEDAPVSAMRDLHAVQSAIAAGREQPAAQAALLARMAETWPKLDPSAWTDGRNARALAAYLLNGGDPRPVRPIAEALGPDAEGGLVAGALFYRDARLDEARAKLGRIDPRALPPDLGGQVALVQASLLPPADHAGAQARLDLARLLMPGTLVEEAALRRQIFAAGEDGPPAPFADLVRRYRARFRLSAYAANFERAVSASFAARWLKADEAGREALAAVASDGPAQGRATLWAGVARRALLAGRPALAGDAARRVAGDPSADEGVRRAANLYGVAAADLAGGPGAPLQFLSPDGLSAPDRALRAAALLVGRNVRAPLTAPPADPSAAKSPDGRDALIARAERLLNQNRPQP